MSLPLESRNGSPSPLGATVQGDGVNFSLHAPEAQSVDLLLFRNPDDPQPDRTLTLDAEQNRTASFWHILVPGTGHGQVYGWRVRGPRPLDGDKVVLDPYARAVTGNLVYQRRAAMNLGDNAAHCLRGVVVDNSLYDWEGDQPLPPPAGREVILEIHPAGFTKDPSSGLPAELRGTYAGFIEKIPYLRDLGITTVELLPVHQHDEQDAPAGKTNFWGYSSISFFAPHAAYARNNQLAGPVDEFRDLVKALHRSGLRVILDVVYNHTAEGGAQGPTLSWRGLDNPGYYLLDKPQGPYLDFTGCGNTIRANGPVARRLILDSLRYWVQEMHVDGFRFDLASALTRGPGGVVLADPPLINAIDHDPVLAGTTLIAESWDAAGLYQVGKFPSRRFGQWNGPFRDHARAFWRADSGTIENLMARIVGSPDILSAPSERPSHSINYVTCHDGFCLNDLVSYADKNNQDNGEDNRDGSDHNLSCNHGQEGPTDDPAIESLRLRQMRNFFCLLLLSHGTPMLLHGDEIRHTRRGNNNPWCQDNELNWTNWNLTRDQVDLHRFVSLLIHFTRKLPILNEDRFWAATSPEKPGDITWHGTKPRQPDWTAQSHCLGFALADETLVLLNASDQEKNFQLPGLDSERQWCRVIDTSRPSPRDILSSREAEPVPGGEIVLIPKSTVVLIIRQSTI